MALKRKRSSSFFSPTAQSTSMTTTFTPPSSAESPTRIQFGAEDISMGNTTAPHQVDNWSMTTSPLYDENSPPADLNSRTRKRFRDGRPEESVIHETTYNILFAAARSPPPNPSSPIAIAPTQQPRLSHPHRRSAPQPSLHQFWNLPTPHKTSSTNNSPRASTAGASLANAAAFLQSQSFTGGIQNHDSKVHVNVPRCEDCEGDLSGAGRYGTLDSNMMDLDIPADGEVDLPAYSCLSCNRVVCDLCAVVSVGEGRECLQCRTSPNRPVGGKSGMDKRWVGGIGWCGVDCY